MIAASGENLLAQDLVAPTPTGYIAVFDEKEAPAYRAAPSCWHDRAGSGV